MTIEMIVLLAVFVVSTCIFMFILNITPLLAEMAWELIDHVKDTPNRRKESRERATQERKDQIVRVQRITKQARKEYRDGL